MQKKEYYDVVIAGGGTAGTIAAIAAARDGQDTAVIEPNFFLGGISTGSGMAEMNSAGFQGKELYGGIEKEIFDELIKTGNGEYHFSVPMSSNPNIKIDRLRYNPEFLKIILEEKAKAAGVSIYYGASVISALEEHKLCAIKFRQGEGFQTLNAGCLIDATGECKVIRMLGYETRMKPKQEQLISTLLFFLSRVDIAALTEAISDGRLKSIMEQGYKKGILKGHILAFSPVPNTDKVSVNITRLKIDCEDPQSIAEGYSEGRKQILDAIPFIKETVPGMKEAYLSETAPIMGVRDSRKLVGEYELTLEDLEQMKAFRDTIAVGSYPMDLHDPATNNVIWKTMPGLYEIPYRSIVPKGAGRILAAGRGISASEEAFAAIRVMPIVMNVGEAAGYAASLIVKKGCLATELDGKELKQYLKQKGLNI